MGDSVNLNDFKNQKKYKQIVADFDKILRVFDLAQRSLVFFKRYKHVQEVISILETNTTLLNIYKRKYLAEIEKAKK